MLDYFIQAAPETVRMNIILGVTSSLIASIITGIIGFLVGRSRSKRRYKKQIEAAGERYASRLGGLIKTSTRYSTYHSQLEESARAIVALRDQYRDRFATPSQMFNSEIDQLSIIIKNTLPGETTTEQR